MARRKRGEGSITKRLDGRYEVRVIDALSGRRRSLFAHTEDDAVAALRKAHADNAAGIGIGNERTTLARYMEDWLASVESSLRPNTFTRYESVTHRHIIPRIGRVKLRALTPNHVRRLYADLAKDGIHRKGQKPRGLAPRSIHKIHAVLHRALEQAAKDGEVVRNVAALVDLPRVPHREIQVISGEQMKVLLVEAEADRFAAAYVVAVTTGMRWGELFGMRWTDVDLDAGAIQVRRSLIQVKGGGLVFDDTKTARSRRTVHLSQYAVDALREHRQRQREERIAALGWADRDLVFASEIGTPIHPSNFRSRSWLPLRKKAGIPEAFTFHCPRHTAASHALAAGIPVTVVSEQLGHASTSMTLDVYGHMIPSQQRAVADAMDALLTRSVPS